MERLNLNITGDMRVRLRQVAEKRQRTESEVARELLLTAIEEAERDEFFRQVAASRTPDLDRRYLEVHEAFEKIDG
jgi:hypothetical protein